MLVENSLIHVGGENLSVTLSLGGTPARPDDTVESLVKRADSLMYASKESGRNCVTIGE